MLFIKVQLISLLIHQSHVIKSKKEAFLGYVLSYNISYRDIYRENNVCNFLHFFKFLGVY